MTTSFDFIIDLHYTYKQARSNCSYGGTPTKVLSDEEREDGENLSPLFPLEYRSLCCYPLKMENLSPLFQRQKEGRRKKMENLSPLFQRRPKSIRALISDATLITVKVCENL